LAHTVDAVATGCCKNLEKRCSINDFIDKELCSISYISTENVVEAVLHLGQGALLAKADVKEAFRIIPVTPEDRLLLAMLWKRGALP